MEYVLSINDEEYFPDSVEDLKELCRIIEKNEFSEVWLQQKDGAGLCVLINKKDAFLMFLREEGDSGFSSRNFDCINSKNDEIEFMLSNGQVDRFPKNHCVSTEKALKTILYFFEKHDKPNWINWNED